MGDIFTPPLGFLRRIHRFPDPQPRCPRPQVLLDSRLSSFWRGSSGKMSILFNLSAVPATASGLPVNPYDYYQTALINGMVGLFVSSIRSEESANLTGGLI